MAVSHPLVAKMLTMATLQLGLAHRGRPRCEKWHRPLASFATLLIQSDRLGTSKAATLRVLCEMRERRKMHAEEKAHRIPVLISIPLVTCMLPVMMGVLIPPAAIRVIR